MMPRFRPSLLALALGICSASALAAPQSIPDVAGPTSALVPPTLRDPLLRRRGERIFGDHYRALAEPM